MSTSQPRRTRVSLNVLVVLALCAALALWGEATFAAGGWRPEEPAVAVALGCAMDAVRRRRAARRTPAR